MQDLMQRLSRLFAGGFRIFFLSTALYAALLMVGWVGVLAFGWPVSGSNPLAWHAHEMLFGVVVAAIAGFLLTAVPNWTGTQPLAGRGLLALWGVWLLARLGYWLFDPNAAGTASALVIGLDLAFLPLLALAVALPIVRSGNHRNLVMVVLLLVMWLANLFHHFAESPVRGNVLMLDLVTMMMIIIGGRITPLFTRNWLNRNGLAGDRVRSFKPVEILSVALAVAVFVLALLDVSAVVFGSIALAAGLAHLVRLIGWQGWRAWRDPLVWVLHLGYAWIALAFFVRGWGALDPLLRDNAWMHAIGVGAMGTLIIGVMARVCLGHTGRELKLHYTGWLMFALVTVAAVTRTAYAAGWLSSIGLLWLSALTWIIAFVHFAILYFPIVSAPRADGKPG
ncbi:MAG: NnrS family protein [Wenzhouxiangellaceae bacterium]